MILVTRPDTYARFVETYNALVSKNDATVAYILFTDPAYVTRIAAVFKNTPDVRLDVTFGNPTLTVADFLINFPDAIAVSGISVGV